MSKEHELELEELSAPDGDPAVPVEEYDWLSEEDTAESSRVTDKPASDDVEFRMVRSLTLADGTVLESGETYTWPEDEFDEMMYDLNLRTDRLRRVERL